MEANQLFEGLATLNRIASGTVLNCPWMARVSVNDGRKAFSGTGGVHQSRTAL